MAELMLHVDLKDKPKHLKYEDGDIFHAKNDRHILCDHTQRICNIKRVDFKSNGLRDVESLPFQMALITSLYRFDRVSQAEVKRTNLITLEEEIFGEKAIDVQLHINIVTQHDLHKVFGEVGSEIWFGGKTSFSVDNLNRLWNEIESRTDRKKINYKESRPNSAMLKKYLLLETEDFTDSRSDELLQPLIDETLTTDDTNRVIKARKYNVKYKDLSELKQKDLNNVLNSTKKVDVRKRKKFKENLIVELKVI